MSGLVGGAQPLPTLRGTDKRCLSEHYRQDVELAIFGPVERDYRSPWWPRSGFVGDLGPDVPVLEGDWWGDPDITAGAITRYGVVGVTRDQYGSPLGGVTVKLYRTSTDEMVHSVVSDPSGNYYVSSPYYPDTHYIVVYKTGSPDVFGTSTNKLVGG